MKKILLAAAIALVAGAGSQAAVPEAVLPGVAQGTVSHLRYDASAPQKKAAPARKGSKVTAASLIGKKFMAFYNDRYNSANNGFYIEADTVNQGGLILKRFARGYDVRAVFDELTGTIIIPTGVVVYTSATNGPYTMYNLNATAGTYNSNAITGYVDEDFITFDSGVYVQYEANDTKYYIVWMQDIAAQPANAMAIWTNATSNATVNMPLIVNKIAKDSIAITGMSAYAYNYYCKVPFVINEADMQVTQKWLSEMVDTTTNRRYYLGGTTSSGSITSVTMTADTTTNGTTKLNMPTMWYVYNTTGTSYSGYKFAPANFIIDYNIFTAPVEVEEKDDDEPVIDGIHYLISRNTRTAQVTGADADVTAINIPVSFTQASKEYKVTSIASKAFYQKTKIKSVKTSVKDIGSEAFYGCTAMTSLTLDSGVNTIGDAAFRGCTKNKSIIIPATCTSIGTYAFYNHSAATTLTIPEGVTSIGNSAFRSCTKITTLKLPYSLGYLGNLAFNGCTGLTEVYVSGQLRLIDLNTFGGCTALKKVTLERGVETIGSNAFNGCTKLTDVSLPPSMRLLDEGAFTGCKGLKTLTLPSSVKTIGKYCFDGCTGLDSITLPKMGLNTIELGAFDNCSSLITFTIPESVTYIGSMAFTGCYSLATVKYMAEEPITAQDDVFDSSTYSYAKLLVYPTALDKIKTILPWSKFATIEADYTSVAGVEADSEDIKEIYTISGLRVAGSLDELPQGIYVVREGSRTYKVVK